MNNFLQLDVNPKNFLQVSQSKVTVLRITND